jgi:hypothetical protein
MPFDGGISTDVASNLKRNRFLFSGGVKWLKKVILPDKARWQDDTI